MAVNSLFRVIIYENYICIRDGLYKYTHLYISIKYTGGILYMPILYAYTA